MKTWAAAWRSVSGALLVAACAGAGADNTLYQEQGELIRAPQAIARLGPDLFGDQVNLYTGALEFVQTDTSLPGNNALAVGVGRRYVAGSTFYGPTGLFGFWDLEIPHLHGVFSLAAGWSNPYASGRCSQLGAPAVVRGLRGGASWVADEYWHGSFLYVPGQGDQELLRGGFAAGPRDGQAYPVATTGRWALRCLPALANAGTSNSASGEGFVALAPDGTQYRFDWLVTRPMEPLTKPTPLGDFDNLARNDIWILPTTITDRYGNTVTYQYDPAHPQRITRIASSDGRVVSFTYTGVYDMVATASDGSRTWNYAYDGQNNLSTVTRPDGSSWQLAGVAAMAYNLEYLLDPDCDTSGNPDSTLRTGTLVHPSGATGTFVLRPTLHGRSWVTRSCRGGPVTPTYATFPRYFATQALISKTLSGPNLPALQWSYDYGPTSASWSPCSGCAETKTVTVTAPQGWVTRHTFGNRFLVNEGKLLLQEEGWSAGATPLRSTAFQYHNFGSIGSSGQSRGDSGLNSMMLPVELKTITQQGLSFSWSVGVFDGLFRPLTVTRASSAGDSRTEVTQYFDQTALWVLGQIYSVTEPTTGLVLESHAYDTATAVRLSSQAFGLPEASYAYYPDGTLQARYDPLGRATTYANYMRGLAQNVTYRDGRSESVMVDNLGLVTAFSDAFNGPANPSRYSYDSMGRLASITPPGGDAASYYPTLLSFERVAVAENGLQPGHWRQTISTGNARSVRYYDELWRPLLSQRYDSSDIAGTQSMQQMGYDADGHTNFTSRPLPQIVLGTTAVYGMHLSYDALGRVTRQVQDSELGPLTTRTDYLANFTRQLTNPRNQVYSTHFQAFDTPSEDAITRIAAPEGMTVQIQRNLFGRPVSITRSGNDGGSGSATATRSYAYDAHLRLCKTLEPETGATVQDYDAAGNLAWRASGLALPDATRCDTSGAPDARKLVYGYDARDRLTGVNYGDGSPAVSRSYTADGLPETVSAAGSTWTYGYNHRRLLTQELLAYGGGSFSFDRGIDAYGHSATLRYPDGAVVDEAPDALGQARQVSGYASAASHLPDGALGSYRLGNGIVHSLSQNLRGLPQLWADAGVVQDQTTYDANANVTAIVDQVGGSAARSMGYDGLDRLIAANGPWGQGLYTYDGLDNLRSSSVGTRSLSHIIDAATNRLTGLVGSQNLALAYDANGNLVSRGGQAFSFDIGNRLQSAIGKADYVYDGLGRRLLARHADGSTRLQLYSQAGQLLYSLDSRQGSTRHVYLGRQLIAETNSLTGTTYVHTDALGSPVARTSAGATLLSTTRYEPYGATAAGLNPDGIGYTGHVNDPDTGLVYMQQRYYDPIAGRFLSVDPVVTDWDSGSSFNRYVYAQNNPYRYTDPDGRNPAAVARVGLTSYRVATNLGAGRLGSWIGIRVYDVLHQEGNSADDASDAAVKGLTAGLEGQKGIYVDPNGNAADALDSLPGEVGENGQKTLPDGSVAGVHVSTTPGPTQGMRTVHIHRPAGKGDRKIRYPNDKQKEKEKPKEEKPKEEKPKEDPK